MSYQQFRPTGFKLLPEIVKNLLIINGIMFLAMIVARSSFGIDLNDILGLHYFSSQEFKPYQLITYMFMHGSFGHLFFNMFALWMFGNAIENVWGGKRFLIYYLITGLGAAFVHYLIVFFQISPDIAQMNAYIANPDIDKLLAFVGSHQFQISQLGTPEIWSSFTHFEKAFNSLQYNPQDSDALDATVVFMREYLEHFKNMPNVIGASGSLFGILLAFGMLFPNSIIYIYFAFPIKAKYFVLAYGLIELISGIRNNPGDNVAHFAHLGGMIFGFFLIKYWRRKGCY